MVTPGAKKVSDDAAVDVINPDGRGRFLLVCEHASHAIPAEFDHLGLPADLRQSHIAWDPGALAVATAMAARLDAPLVAPTASRLLYDCNRPPEAPSAIPEKSERFEIPGNTGLSAAERQARVDRFYRPFHDALSARIDRQMRLHAAPMIVTVHSFTPTYHGVRRNLDIGILHDSDSRLADALIAAIEADTEFVVRRNEPYGPKDGVTHTLRVQALPRGLANVMIEIRNDLIGRAEDQRAMAEILASCAEKAAARLPEDRREAPTEF